MDYDQIVSYAGIMDDTLKIIDIQVPEMISYKAFFDQRRNS